MSDSQRNKRDELMERLPKSGYQSFTAGEKIFFSLWWFQAETNNGGLHQFFFNDLGAYAADALHALELIGASRTADILRRAISVFPDSQVPTDILRRGQILCDLPDELQWERLGELTTKLFQVREPIAEYFEAYNQTHQTSLQGFTSSTRA
jgi:hypothetical protein